MKKLAGIFNDVIGPVMRGPSSSHTAASWRIARICLEILNEPLKSALIEFDENGAWATNYIEQGTAMGIEGGLLALEISDSRMKNTGELAKEREVSIQYKISSFPTRHANTVRISLEGTKGNKVQVISVSLGGGAIEIQQIKNISVKIKGDFFELLLFKKIGEEIPKDIQDLIFKEKNVLEINENDAQIIQIKSSRKYSEILIQQYRNCSAFESVLDIDPVLPVISGNEIQMPFSSIASLLDYAAKENLDLGELGLLYEKCQSGWSETELSSQMESLITIIENSIETGLNGTKYKDRILHQQAHLVHEAAANKKILPNSLVNHIVANVTAIMEAKSALELIVANPTAGSCGTIGGLVKAVSEDLNANKEEVIKAYFAAGIVGAYFANGPGFSAEEHGCQVECGAASGMAAAAIAQLYGATAKQAIDAASMAIQNMIGLICDPVADRVEVPCLGKNVSAAMNALSSATMACSGFNAVIPLNEVIETVSAVSKQMPSCVKCTGKGGLAITKTSIDLKRNLDEKR